MYEQYEKKIIKIKKILKAIARWKWVELCAIIALIVGLVYVFSLPDDAKPAGGMVTENGEEAGTLSGADGPQAEDENGKGDSDSKDDGDKDDDSDDEKIVIKEPEDNEQVIAKKEFASSSTQSVTIMKIKSDYRGNIYLREKSYGNYNGSGFKAVPTYEVKKGMTNPLAFSGLSARNEGVKIDVSINTMGNFSYLLPYYHDTAEGFLNDNYAKLSSNIYDVYFILPPKSFDLIHAKVPEKYSEEEKKYREFVHANYLSVPDSTRAELEKIAKEKGIDKNSDSLIRDICSYVKGAAVYDLKFKAYPEDEDMVVYFLTVNKAGICQHFAAAATMMYRTMGIPARYVEGVLAGCDGSGEWNEVKASKAHAWTEIYIDGLGWLPIDATAGYSGGGQGMGAMEEMYDFSNIMNDSLGLGELNLNLGSGGLIFDLDFDLTDIEKDKLPHKTEEEIIDDDGRIVITLTPPFITKEYDGLPIYVYGNDWKVEGALADGDKLVINDMMFTDPGDYSDYEYRIYDSSGRLISETKFQNGDFTNIYPEDGGKYRVITNLCQIIIRKKAISIHAIVADDNKSIAEWYITKGALLPGHRVEYIKKGVSYEIKIVDENGNDATYVYDLVLYQHLSIKNSEQEKISKYKSESTDSHILDFEGTQNNYLITDGTLEGK